MHDPRWPRTVSFPCPFSSSNLLFEAHVSAYCFAQSTSNYDSISITHSLAYFQTDQERYLQSKMVPKNDSWHSGCRNSSC